MEQVGKTYGRLILEGMVIVALAGFLFYSISDETGNVGLFGMIGANLPVQNEDYNLYIDFSGGYQEESNKSTPKIVYEGGSLVIGNNKLTDVIKAVDYCGRELKIEVISIKRMDGAELIENYNFETSEIDFSQAGIYVVMVKAIDDIYKSSQCTVKIPVN